MWSTNSETPASTVTLSPMSASGTSSPSDSPGSSPGHRRSTFNCQLTEPSEQISQPSSPLMHAAYLRQPSPLSRAWHSPTTRSRSPSPPRGTQAVVDDVLARRTAPHPAAEQQPSIRASVAAHEQPPPLVALLDALTEDELRATLWGIAGLSEGLAHLTAEAARATIEQRGSGKLVHTA